MLEPLCLAALERRLLRRPPATEGRPSQGTLFPEVKT